MNLFFIDDKNEIYFRPDTTLDKECPVYYVPDDIEVLEYSAFHYVRMDRAGKYIAPRFAERYYSTIGKGIALYGYEKGERNEMLANLLDNSSIVEEAVPLDSFDQPGLIQSMDEAIARISRRTSLKTGDYVCFCESSRKPTGIGETIRLSEKKTLLIK